MSQGTFSNTLIRLGAFKRTFVFCPKIDFFSKGLVQGFWSKMNQIFEVGIFHLLMALGISSCRETPLGIIFKCPSERLFCLTLTRTSSLSGYFFVPCPLRGLKCVAGDVLGHTDSIRSF